MFMGDLILVSAPVPLGLIKSLNLVGVGTRPKGFADSSGLGDRA